MQAPARRDGTGKERLNPVRDRRDLTGRDSNAVIRRDGSTLSKKKIGLQLRPASIERMTAAPGADRTESSNEHSGFGFTGR